MERRTVIVFIRNYSSQSRVSNIVFYTVSEIGLDCVHVKGACQRRYFKLQRENRNTTRCQDAVKFGKPKILGRFGEVGKY